MSQGWPQFIPVGKNQSPVPLSKLCGWGKWKSENEWDEIGTYRLRDEAFDIFGGQFKELKVVGSRPITGARMMLFELARQVIGSDTPNYPQEVGDCVSFGAKNGIEHVQFLPIINGVRREFKRVFCPYLYGTGRVFEGGGQLGPNQDGSLGSWQASAVMKYGTIAIDAPGCPNYSGQIARKWGARPGPPEKFVEMGKERLVKSAALVRTWEQVVEAVINGYPVTVASNVGFTMQPTRDGFHRREGQWAHQMCIIGVDNENAKPHACIVNSWGDVHGTIKDFKTGENWPAGTLRVRPEDVAVILAANDSFAYSQFDGFPGQELDPNLFDIFDGVI